MIDLKAARANPEPVRAALARKGAAEAFDALGSFAEGYADQNERDYAALKHAADSGRVTTEAQGEIGDVSP